MPHLSVKLSPVELRSAVGDWLDANGFVTTDALAISVDSAGIVTACTGVRLPAQKNSDKQV